MSEHDQSGGQSQTTAKFSADVLARFEALGRTVSADERSAIASLPSGSALLIVRRGPHTGARFLLMNDETIAGRHPMVDIFLDDVTVSRRHAQFLREGFRFWVTDLHSLNGTFCDGERIDGRVQLHDGAEVQVGKFKLTFYSSLHDTVKPEAE